jgi:murein DD-endopeptidase MepM/ murein hydrolase activator NlpD
VRSALWLVAMGILIGAGTALAADVKRCRLADGFDFPVGKPDAVGYYKSRGFYPNGHMGEDWNGRGGGNSDLGAPIYSIGRGVVVLSENIRVGWGNCIIIRHAFRDASGKISMIDSQYGHLNERMVKLHQVVEKGQQIGTMGSNNGMYLVHLHFEIRKNLKIGMNRSQFARDYSNYHSPTPFINAHRNLQSSFRKYEIPLKTFAAYGKSLSSIRSTNGSGLDIPIFERSDDGGTGDGSGNSDGGDFWSRLKNKIKGGGVTNGVAEP